jgi:glutamine synthetase
MAIGAPSAVSYLRLRPSVWAGAYACWGLENREAAVRFITGMRGSEQAAANCEVKCFDQSANPYLAIGSVIAAGLDGIERKLELPPETTEDPGSLSTQELAALGAERLPSSLEQSISAFERSGVIGSAMGDPLFGAVLAVRRAELETFRETDPDALLGEHRWRY